MPALGVMRRAEDGFERTGNRKFLGRAQKHDKMPGPAQAIHAGTLPVMQTGKHPAALLKMQPISIEG